MKIVLAKMHDSTNMLLLAGQQYPVNVAYLASALIAAGYEVELWDFCVEPFDEETVKERIRKSRPAMIGASCVTPAIYHGGILAKWAKEIDDNIVTLVGGVHITALPKETMEEFPHFDLGVLTEAEDSILEIAAKVETGSYPSGIPGTVYRDGNDIVTAPTRIDFPDVNTIPYPDRTLLPMELYTEKHAGRGISRKVWNVAEIDSSRGCPYACTFCNVELTHGRKVRFRTPDNILGEIEQCVKQFGTNYILFNDSTFTIRKDRVLDIVRELPKLGIKGYSVNAHVNTVDWEMLDTLAKTGCHRIMYGVESGSDRVLREIKKNSDQQKIRTAFELSKRAGIPNVEGTFILGADPHETEDDMMATETLIKEIAPDIVGIGVITPYPGTSQFHDLERLGLRGDLRWDQYQIFTEGPPPWRIVNYSAEELWQRRNAMLKAYIWTPSFVFRRLRRVKSFTELKYYTGLARSFYDVVVKAA